MVLGLGKIKDGVQRYFRSSEDSRKKAETKVSTPNEEIVRFRPKKKVKAPVSRSNFYVEASFPEDVKVATSFNDASDGNINTVNDSETGASSHKPFLEKKARTFHNVYENVCIERIPATSCPTMSHGLRLDIAAQQPNKEISEGVQPLTICNRAYRSEDKTTFELPRNPQVYWIGNSDRDGYTSPSSVGHYETQGNPNGSRNSQIYQWYFGIFESDPQELGQTVWKPIDQVELENPGALSRRRDSLVPGFVPVTEL